MTRKIAVFTGTRAEYGLLHAMMVEIKNSPDLELQVIAGAMHLAPQFGSTWRAIEADGFLIDAKVDMLLATDTPTGIAKSMGLGLIGLADVFERLKPDMLVVLGDRFEALAAAQTAMLFRVPIVHIHGGETTEGVIDEANRHSITKMSHVHFVAAEPYRKRVIQLGESPETVHTVGAAALDNIATLDVIPRADLEADLGLKISKPLMLITYHPETLQNSSLNAIENLFTALDEYPQATLIFTGSNADSGGGAIDRRIKEYCDANQDRAQHFASLGFRRYLSLMSIADIVVGNSSSGLLEAPAIGVPTVNIGTRQQGRLRSPSVVDCSEDYTDIKTALGLALSPGFKKTAAKKESPYGNPGVAQRMVKVLNSLDLHNILIKSFYDL